jgi:hypothetical protein
MLTCSNSKFNDEKNSNWGRLVLGIILACFMNSYFRSQIQVLVFYHRKGSTNGRPAPRGRGGNYDFNLL